jgi:nucleotide-binding universal stress UspA family protein
LTGVKTGNARAPRVAVDSTGRWPIDPPEPPMSRARYQRILVPVDGSATSRQALDEAIAIARLTGGRIRVLHVVDQVPSLVEGGGRLGAEVLDVLRDAGKRLLAEACARAHAGDVPVESTLIETPVGRLSDSVARQAADWQADLLVLGTHGRRGANDLGLGGDAEQILRCAALPVLVVRDGAPRSA